MVNPPQEEENNSVIRWSGKRDRSTATLEQQPFSKTMTEVLQSISSDVPQIFHDQAKTVASWIELLDQGKGTDDPQIQTFIQELKDTAFIGKVYLHHRLTAFFNGPDPKVALPSWLFESRKIQREDWNGGEERRQITQQLFNTWVTKESLPSSRGSHGTYFKFSEEDLPELDPRAFKMYVEGEELMMGLMSGLLPNMIDKMKNEDIKPLEMKLFESDNLVLYFSDKADQLAAESFFRSQDINFRGPAQDVFELESDSTGNITTRVYTSNDGALGASGHNRIEYDLKVYTPAEFLENYLRMCLFGGKNPSEPYKTSFVYLTGETKPDRDILKHAEAIAHYPVLYVPNRHTAQVSLYKG